ncbi:MAG: efflux RND transporter periplasmic adaptor subunit [Romboutsia sp.]|nr:efflux RND transporter periplasmic adaptor subunit [Romboutsia sp.]
MFNSKIKFVSLGLVCMLGLTGCSSTSSNEKDSASTTKEVEVTKGSIREEISLSGNVKANKTSTVSAGENSTVEEIYVDTNEDVSEGEDIILLENGNVIEAPFDGKISKISVSEGDSVNSNTSVFNIIDNSGFKIETSVDESEVSKVSTGQKVEVSVDAIDKEYEGVVTRVDAEATTSGNSTSFGIVIELEGDFENLYSGMSSEMNIVIKESTDVLVVPVQAVSNKNGKYIVSVKDGDSTKEVEVTVGAQDSSFVEITSGLNEGDVVVYEQATQSNKGQMGQGQGMPGGMQMPGGGDMPSPPSGGNGGQMPSGGPSGRSN